jgi:hypothetical protein
MVVSGEPPAESFDSLIFPAEVPEPKGVDDRPGGAVHADRQDDETVALHHASLLVAVRRAGRPRGAHDLVIAATAAAAGRTVVSSDRRAFDDLPGVIAIDHRSE